MSEETKSVVEQLDEYLAGDRPGNRRFEGDEGYLDIVARSQFPEKFDPEPKVEVVREVIPEGYVLDPDAAEYQKRSKRRDFQQVRDRMLSTLSREDLEYIDGDYERFNFEFDAVAETLKQEREEREAKEAKEREARDRQSEYERKILAKLGSGDWRTQDAAAKIAERYLK
jgi:hypothetical protein